MMHVLSIFRLSITYGILAIGVFVATVGAFLHHRSQKPTRYQESLNCSSNQEEYYQIQCILICMAIFIALYSPLDKWLAGMHYQQLSSDGEVVAASPERLQSYQNDRELAELCLEFCQEARQHNYPVYPGITP